MRTRYMVCTIMLLMSCGGALQEAFSDTEKHGEMLSKCRAKARVAYYRNDAGYDGAWKVYEDCKDAGIATEDDE